MTELFEFPSPECQAEYCLLCNDRLSDCCPCESFLSLSDSDRFPLDEDGLLGYLSEVK